MVGLGQMGSGIARNLDRAGLLVGAFDAAPGAFAAAGLSEGVIDAPVAQLMEMAEIMIFAVPTTAAIRDAIGRARGRPGQVIVDLTTSDPGESAAYAAIRAAAGQTYLDAAMTGGAAGADAGTLTLMIGGELAVFEKARPAMSAFAGEMFHLGPVGAGHAMKLIHNMILHSMFLATCEGVTVAERAGIDAATAIAVLNAGNARSFISEVRFPRDILSGTMQARSTVSNLEKDLGLAVDYCARIGAVAPYGALTRDLLGSAIRDGMERKDFSHLFPRFEELAKRSVTDAP
jgi:3-hydroxyisobutyrate dehydrogenase